MTSIHQVILDGRLSQLNLLVNRIGCNVNEKDAYGRTPLHLAVLSDQENYGYRVARLLLNGSADINSVDFQQRTPLVYACILNRPKLVTLFLETKSIDWNLVDYESYYILHHTAVSSQTSILEEIIRELKLINFPIDCKTNLGYTPLTLAIKSYRFDNAIYLLEHTDASPFTVDDEYNLTCQQWTQTVKPKLNEWTSYNQKSHININRKKILDKNIPNYKYFFGSQSPYQCKMLLCNHHHMKTLHESTYVPAIFSPSTKDRKLLTTTTTSISQNRTKFKPSYQLWMQLVQLFHDRALKLKENQEKTEDHSVIKVKIRREKTWAGHEMKSMLNRSKLNSKKDVITLINHYSIMLTNDNDEQLTSSFVDRPKSILRPIESTKKCRLVKEVTFATDEML